MQVVKAPVQTSVLQGVQLTKRQVSQTPSTYEISITNSRKRTVVVELKLEGDIKHDPLIVKEIRPNETIKCDLIEAEDFIVDWSWGEK